MRSEVAISPARGRVVDGNIRQPNDGCDGWMVIILDKCSQTIQVNSSRAHSMWSAVLHASRCGIVVVEGARVRGSIRRSSPTMPMKKSLIFVQKCTAAVLNSFRAIYLKFRCTIDVSWSGLQSRSEFVCKSVTLDVSSRVQRQFCACRIKKSFQIIHVCRQNIHLKDPK